MGVCSRRLRGRANLESDKHTGKPGAFAICPSARTPMVWPVQVWSHFFGMKHFLSSMSFSSSRCSGGSHHARPEEATVDVCVQKSFTHIEERAQRAAPPKVVLRSSTLVVLFHVRNLAAYGGRKSESTIWK
jgi:hypothetical protein